MAIQDNVRVMKVGCRIVDGVLVGAEITGAVEYKDGKLRDELTSSFEVDVTKEPPAVQDVAAQIAAWALLKLIDHRNERK